MIEIVVNGDSQSIPEGQTLMGLLSQLDLDPARVAIELDRKIVKQPHCDASPRACSRSAP